MLEVLAAGLSAIRAASWRLRVGHLQEVLVMAVPIHNLMHLESQIHGISQPLQRYFDLASTLSQPAAQGLAGQLGKTVSLALRVVAVRVASGQEIGTIPDGDGSGFGLGRRLLVQRLLQAPTQKGQRRLRVLTGHGPIGALAGSAAAVSGFVRLAGTVTIHRPSIRFNTFLFGLFSFPRGVIGLESLFRLFRQLLKVDAILFQNIFQQRRKEMVRTGGGGKTAKYGRKNQRITFGADNLKNNHDGCQGKPETTGEQAHHAEDDAGHHGAALQQLSIFLRKQTTYGATQEAAGDQHRFQHIRRAADCHPQDQGQTLPNGKEKQMSQGYGLGHGDLQTFGANAPDAPQAGGTEDQGAKGCCDEGL
mmetsp:Transcript_15741/g.32834  ORF Transcript_15741/g.32834 Transcript_15741/m.32834 type:complete len:363 (-) Transcript_15741:521-1609(-)